MVVGYPFVAVLKSEFVFLLAFSLKTWNEP